MRHRVAVRGEIPGLAYLAARGLPAGSCLASKEKLHGYAASGCRQAGRHARGNSELDQLQLIVRVGDDGRGVLMLSVAETSPDTFFGILPAALMLGAPCLAISS